MAKQANVCFVIETSVYYKILIAEVRMIFNMDYEHLSINSKS